MVVERNVGMPEITVLDRNFGPTKVTVVNNNFGPTKAMNVVKGCLSGHKSKLMGNHRLFGPANWTIVKINVQKLLAWASKLLHLDWGAFMGGGLGVEDLVVEDWVVEEKMLEEIVVEKGVGYTYVPTYTYGLKCLGKIMAYLMTFFSLSL